jgi:ubiquinone/menaquinone biosynthesis C-methylase UbiE
MKSKDLFPAIFSRHAAAYQRRLDEVMRRGETRGRQRVIELVGARPGMRVLDLACGPGNLSRRLAALVAPGGEVVGIDLAQGMVQIARETAIPNARFEVMDIEALEFGDGSFDAAACGHGLQFAGDLGQALREARRVLRAGGRLAASVPVSGINNAVWRELDRVTDRWLPPAPRAIDQQPTTQAVGDAIGFRRAALAAGFAAAYVEVVEETVHWASAEQLVSMFAGWWDCASRLEGIDPDQRQAFMKEATAALKHEHPGAIETTGRNHVLLAKV